MRSGSDSLTEPTAGIAVHPIVRFAGVTKSYEGRTVVVQPLDLDVRRGEFLTLLGPSGSGKTTTLMMLAGFESPTTGHIMLNGARVDAVPPFRRAIGVVFQNYALFPHLSVAENVAFPLSVRKRPRAEIALRVQRALAMVKLESFHDRRPLQLSGGQQQRVALARALVFDPDLVLLDEPLGALDKQLREQLQYELKSLHTQLGVTMIYVTHDQSEALTMSDRIAVFNDGRIEQIADPRTLYETPQSLFVARFIGENNLIHVIADRIDADWVEARLTGGGTLRARATPGVRVNAASIATIRPENIRIVPVSAPIPAKAGMLAGRVTDITYLGDHQRFRVQTDCGEIVVKSAIEPGDRSFDGRAPVMLLWAPEHCRLFPA